MRRRRVLLQVVLPLILSLSVWAFLRDDRGPKALTDLIIRYDVPVGRDWAWRRHQAERHEELEATVRATMRVLSQQINCGGRIESAVPLFPEDGRYTYPDLVSSKAQEKPRDRSPGAWGAIE